MAATKVATICGTRDMRLKRDVLVTEWGSHFERWFLPRDIQHITIRSS